jgi:hypothetical protein
VANQLRYGPADFDAAAGTAAADVLARLGLLLAPGAAPLDALGVCARPHGCLRLCGAPERPCQPCGEFRCHACVKLHGAACEHICDACGKPNDDLLQCEGGGEDGCQMQINNPDGVHDSWNGVCAECSFMCAQCDHIGCTWCVQQSELDGSVLCVNCSLQQEEDELDEEDEGEDGW